MKIAFETFFDDGADWVFPPPSSPNLGNRAAGEAVMTASGGLMLSPNADGEDRYLAFSWEQVGASHLQLLVDLAASGEAFDLVDFAGNLVTVVAQAPQYELLPGVEDLDGSEMYRVSAEFDYVHDGGNQFGKQPRRALRALTHTGKFAPTWKDTGGKKAFFRVVSVLPSAGATVGHDAEIRVTFSSPPDPAWFNKADGDPTTDDNNAYVEEVTGSIRVHGTWTIDGNDAVFKAPYGFLPGNHRLVLRGGRTFGLRSVDSWWLREDYLHPFTVDSSTTIRTDSLSFTGLRVIKYPRTFAELNTSPSAEITVALDFDDVLMDASKMGVQVRYIDPLNQGSYRVRVTSRTTDGGRSIVLTHSVPSFGDIEYTCRGVNYGSLFAIVGKRRGGLARSVVERLPLNDLTAQTLTKTYARRQLVGMVLRTAPNAGSLGALVQDGYYSNISGQTVERYIFEPPSMKRVTNMLYKGIEFIDTATGAPYTADAYSLLSITSGGTTISTPTVPASYYSSSGDTVVTRQTGSSKYHRALFSLNETASTNVMGATSSLPAAYKHLTYPSANVTGAGSHIGILQDDGPSAALVRSEVFWEWTGQDYSSDAAATTTAGGTLAITSVYNIFGGEFFVIFDRTLLDGDYPIDGVVVKSPDGRFLPSRASIHSTGRLRVEVSGYQNDTIYTVSVRPHGMLRGEGGATCNAVGYTTTTMAADTAISAQAAALELSIANPASNPAPGSTIAAGSFLDVRMLIGGAITTFDNADYSLVGVYKIDQIGRRTAVVGWSLIPHTNGFFLYDCFPNEASIYEVEIPGGSSGVSVVSSGSTALMRDERVTLRYATAWSVENQPPPRSNLAVLNGRPVRARWGFDTGSPFLGSPAPFSLEGGLGLIPPGEATNKAVKLGSVTGGSDLGLLRAGAGTLAMLVKLTTTAGWIDLNVDGLRLYLDGPAAGSKTLQASASWLDQGVWLSASASLVVATSASLVGKWVLMYLQASGNSLTASLSADGGTFGGSVLSVGSGASQPSPASLTLAGLDSQVSEIIALDEAASRPDLEAYLGL